MRVLNRRCPGDVVRALVNARGVGVTSVWELTGSHAVFIVRATYLTSLDRVQRCSDDGLSHGITREGEGLLDPGFGANRVQILGVFEQPDAVEPAVKEASSAGLQVDVTQVVQLVDPPDLGWSQLRGGHKHHFVHAHNSLSAVAKYFWRDDHIFQVFGEEGDRPSRRLPAVTALFGEPR